jgi:hypothetical protein
MYPETIEWSEKIVKQYPLEQKEAQHLIASSYYHMMDINSCLQHLAYIWQTGKESFDEDYLYDSRFRQMFINIIQLSNKFKNKES